MVEPSVAIGIIGFVVGALVGMTGVGGGALTMPLLIFWVGVRPIVAVGTDLTFLAVLKIVGAWAHHRWGNVDWRLVKLLAFGSVPGAVIGLGLLTYLRSISPELIDTIITRLLGTILITVSIIILARFVLRNRPIIASLRKPQVSQDNDPAAAFTVALGFVVGILVSLTSVGGGTLVVAALALFYQTSGRRIVGTDIAHALILTSVAASGHLGLGNVNILLVGNLLMGAIPGILIGSRITIQIPEQGLRAILASVLLAAGLRLL